MQVLGKEAGYLCQERLHMCVFPQDLMRELDDKEGVIKSVQEKAESLLLENHPARLTIEVI